MIFRFDYKPAETKSYNSNAQIKTQYIATSLQRPVAILLAYKKD